MTKTYLRYDFERAHNIEERINMQSTLIDSCLFSICYYCDEEVTKKIKHCLGLVFVLLYFCDEEVLKI